MESSDLKVTAHTPKNTPKIKGNLGTEKNFHQFNSSYGAVICTAFFKKFLISNI